MIQTITDVAGDPRERVLLVLLPPAFGTARDFVDRGFVTAIRERDLKVDVIAAGAIADHYLDQTVVARLHADVIAPARAKGYRRVWLAGISIGGFGSLLTLQAHAAEIEGLLLIAPYLGSRPVVNEVLRAGSLAQWQPQRAAPDDHEQQLLAWLRDVLSVPALSPPIYAGYGTQDRFAPSIELLANALPEDRVVRQPGEHDWATWIALWHALLDLDPFGARALC
jgi:pimeloyl-ACP methyl ester carboxylesterase